MLRLLIAIILTAGAPPQRPSANPLHRITQIGKQFSAANIRISAGDSIVFINSDAVMHNVFSTSAGFKFNLKSQKPGTSRVVPFTHRGTATVRCAFHPTMRLTVVVE